MKQLFEQYLAYNFWANKIISDKLLQVPQEILHKDMGSSFGSIYQTCQHMMEVESIWWQRVNLQEPVQLPEKDPGENFAVLAEKWLRLSRQWSSWLVEIPEKNIIHVFGYYNSKKEFFKQPVYEMLLHLVNHQTYHRGQVVTMLRQNKIDKIPATDFIKFSRKK
jgi:uncharacterized damage-inducible protein DinB